MKKRRVRLIRQPSGSSLCGQCCVASLASIPLDKAAVLVGTRGRTSADVIRGALGRLGFCVFGTRRGNLASVWPKAGRPLRAADVVRWVPRGCLIRLRMHGRMGRTSYGRRWSHWALVWDRRVFDSAYGLDPNWGHGIHVASYMEVLPRSRPRR